MRTLLIALVASLPLCVASAQQQDNPRYSTNGGNATISELSNLPIQKLGVDDLLAITVYDSPELTRTVRVGTEGDIRLPMLKKPVHASGLFPADLERTLTQALVEDGVLADPVVTISVVEYRSRPISVMGAVHKPLTFQATGTVRLLDALANAEGLADNAGPDVVINHHNLDADGKSSDLLQRINLKQLISGADPSLNIQLEGGEEIRVPEAGRIFVVGSVNKPGAYYITDGAESSVLKALALSEGIGHISAKQAYIYRGEETATAKTVIPIEIKEILKRKIPDVSLLPNDILYVPDGPRAMLTVLDRVTMMAGGLGAAAIYTTR